MKLYLVGNKYLTFYVHIEGRVILIYLLLLFFLCLLVCPWLGPSFHQEKMDDAKTQFKPLLQWTLRCPLQAQNLHNKTWSVYGQHYDVLQHH
jgi:hypothetical protein